jgi:hypothetical protein
MNTSKNYSAPVFPLTLINVRLSLRLDEVTDNNLAQSFSNKSFSGNTNNQLLLINFLSNSK